MSYPLIRRWFSKEQSCSDRSRTTRPSQQDARGRPGERWPRGGGHHPGPGTRRLVRMQADGNALEPSKDGTLFISGFATSLSVRHNQLVVKTGEGRNIEQARFARASRPRLKRLVVYGKGGYVTFEALALLDQIGCSFAHITRDGSLVVASAAVAPGQGALRRAQASATDG